MVTSSPTLSQPLSRLGRRPGFDHCQARDSDSKLLPAVIGILFLRMLLNLIGILLARRIIAAVDIVTFQVVGWIFAVAGQPLGGCGGHLAAQPGSAPLLRKRGKRNPGEITNAANAGL
jgi:hypothetical protein